MKRITPLTVAALIEQAGGVVQLARALGVSRTTVIGWRTAGAVPGSRIPQIAATFGIPADQLLSLIQGPRSSGSSSTAPIECAA